jgi:NodT family efflux transporter outer membrane factor (OMF) lipoprotein
VDYIIGYDTTPAVAAGIKGILHTLGEAILLVVLVVFVFLQSWRATLIPLLTVPVSLLGTFAVFPMLGFTVNTLTLFGMVLAIGIVVDDAIVVVEAVSHHIEEGMSPREATVQAMREVSGPVIGIALVLSSVFIPVAFIGGLTGRLYQQFALTIAIAVVISAFVALSLSPALSALLLRPSSKRRGWLGGLGLRFNRMFTHATNGYLRLAGTLARRALLSLLLIGLVALGGGALGQMLPQGFIPDEDQGILLVNVQLQNAASLRRTDEACRKLEAILSKTPGIQSFNVVGGLSFIAGASTPYSASFFMRLKPWEERQTPDQQLQGIISRLMREFSKVPEANALVIAPPSLPGFGAAGGFSFVLQDRSGTMSVQELGENLQTFLSAARQHPELTRLFSAFDATVPQLSLEVDREKVRTLGVPITEVFATLSAALGGAYVNDFNRFGRLYRVYVQAEPGYRQQPSDIGQFYVRSQRTNVMIPLSTLMTVNPNAGTELTIRYNLFRSVDISGAAAPGYSSGQAMRVLEDLAARVLPREMGYEYTGLSYQEKRAPNPWPTFVLAVVFVFLLLAALYESWSLPWSVLLGTPLVALGAFFGVWLRGFDNNVFVQIGLIMLIGLAAKNSILIVEFAKARREDGKPVVEAALDAARLRFRPIVMTALAFILGVVPLMLATGSGANARQVMGTAVFWGMLVATLFGVLLVPSFFVVVERFRERKPKPVAVLLIVSLPGLFLGSGCKMGPDYRRPEVPVPALWRQQPVMPETIADVPWWSFFQDPALTALISEALTNNSDVRIAVARIEQARGNYRIQRSFLAPTVDASAGWIRARGAEPIAGTAVTGNQFSLIGLLSYEVDIWGRIRRLSEAARAELFAAEEARRAVYIGLISGVASAYFDLRALDEQLLISQRTVHSREKSLELTQVRFNQGQGIVSELDIRQAETQLYTAKATQADLERQVALRENEINLLAGRNPGPVTRGGFLSQPQIRESIPAGLPSELLLRRPDILAAEQRLIAANANIGAARAAYFPSISLTAALGLQSVELRDLFDAGVSRTWRLGPQLAAPIFNAGRIAGGVQVARATREEAVVAYEQAIQNAFREVEDALVSTQKLGEQLDAQAKTVEAERVRLELSELRYESGVASYSDVLDAQRSLFSAELILAQLGSARLTSIAQLYRALGGGWNG